MFTYFVACRDPRFHEAQTGSLEKDAAEEADHSAINI
jgi:hypothetical protein